MKTKKSYIELPVMLDWSEAKTIQWALEDMLSNGLIPFKIAQKLEDYFKEFDKIERKLHN